MRRLLQRSTTLQALLAALEAARGATFGARDAAVAARAGSEAARDAAVGAATQAGTSAGAAEGSAAAAQGSATAAAGSATAAQTVQTAAQAAASAAQGHAATAQAAAQSAGGNATTAVQMRDDAVDARDVAVQRATEAGGSAQTALSAAESARAAALAAGAGYGAAGDARVRLGSRFDVWAQATRLSESVQGPGSISDTGAGPSLVVSGAPGAVVATWLVDLAGNAGANPLANALACAVVADSDAADPDGWDLSLTVEVLRSDGTAAAFVGAAEAVGADGQQILACEAVPLSVAEIVAVATERRQPAPRLRITLAAQVRGLPSARVVRLAMVAAPYYRREAPELFVLREEKRDRKPSVIERPAGGLPGLFDRTYLVTGAGTVGLPPLVPERSEIVVINDSAGTVTLVAPSGTTLRGSAAMPNRGDRRTALFFNSVWYVG